MVQGLPYVFTQEADDISTAISTRENISCIVSVDQGEHRLDAIRRRLTGGSLTVSMQDDGDGTLLALFVARKRRTTFVTSNSTTADTTITCDSLTAAPVAESVYYIGGETIIGTKSGTTINVATRGAYGSEAQPLYGDAQDGMAVYLSPPSWSGRKVTLYGYFSNTDNFTNASLSDVLGTFYVEEAPVYMGNGRWELRCGSATDNFARRKLGTGIRPAKFYAPEKTATGDWSLAIYDGGMLYQFPNVFHDSTYVRMKAPNGDVFVAPLTNEAAGTITVSGNDVMGRFGVTAEADPGSLWEVTPITILMGEAPATMLWAALVSRNGDATNGAYDILPGEQRTEFFGPEYRVGAGILAAEVSFSLFSEAGNGVTNWSYIIDGEVTVEEMMADYCLTHSSIWYASRDGLLSVQRLSGLATKETSELAITNNNVIGEPMVAYDEESIYPRISLTCEYDPISGEFLDEVVVFDAELQARLPDRQDALVLESRSIRPSPSFRANPYARGLTLPGTDLMSVEMMLRRMQTGGGRGRLLVTLTLDVTALLLWPGSTVTVTLDDVPDYEGSTLNGARGRVLSYRPDYDAGKVDVVVSIEERQFYIAPALIITSLGAGYGGAGPHLINVSTTAPENAFSYGSIAPALTIASTWTVRVWDVSANTYEDIAVSSVANTSITLSSATTFTPVAGDFITIPTQDSTWTGTNSNTGFERLDFAFQQARTPGGSPVTRWK
jgi:hypothetical protein